MVFSSAGGSHFMFELNFGLKSELVTVGITDQYLQPDRILPGFKRNSLLKCITILVKQYLWHNMIDIPLRGIISCHCQG